ncbi:MAG TPA: aldo/keto reductase [Chloroflexia bacterium]|nr:aldo/keto reductase [Chloroflexia bacterium]
MQRRRLGRSGIEVSPLGLGCWAIGGPVTLANGEERSPFGWGHVDDEEAVRAIRRAIDLGVNFFDTANNYGAGHSERQLGRGIAGHRGEVVVCTKFATVFDEETSSVYFDREMDLTFDSIRETCEASLRRLNTDYIDLYLLHNGSLDPERVPPVLDHLERLVGEGKIRWYGWSTDHADRAPAFAKGPHCTAIEFRLNLIYDNRDMLAVCDEHDLAAVIKSPLNSGLLSGKFTADTTFPDDDGRKGLSFREGLGAERLRQIEAMRDTMTLDGRTMAQASLGYIWARSERTIPIPGFKTVAQVEENAAAIHCGPLTQQQVRRLDEIMGREPIEG